jgi:hypothetical protein
MRTTFVLFLFLIVLTWDDIMRLESRVKCPSPVNVPRLRAGSTRELYGPSVGKGYAYLQTATSYTDKPRDLDELQMVRSHQIHLHVNARCKHVANTKKFYVLFLFLTLTVIRYVCFVLQQKPLSLG